MSIYEESGYKSRKDYFNSLAEEFDVDIEMVEAMAYTLGRSEDFDGLINALEEYEDMGF